MPADYLFSERGALARSAKKSAAISRGKTGAPRSKNLQDHRTHTTQQSTKSLIVVLPVLWQQPWVGTWVQLM